MFEEFLSRTAPFVLALVQTTMTYWYPGVSEVIEVLRKFQPQAKIILGGNYVTLCPSHAKKLGADLLITADNLEPFWQFINITGDLNQPPLWKIYNRLNTSVLKLSDGCPFNCTYCSVPKVYGKFKPRSLRRALAELQLLLKLGAENIAFYDDALLYKANEVLTPFLEDILKRNIKVNLHTPNALNARFITSELAEVIVKAGFKTFYLGFESVSSQWQGSHFAISSKMGTRQATGSKVLSDELARAVEHLIAAGAAAGNITAYQILGHPAIDIQQLEASMRFVNRLGIRGMLADFSPIPGTPDGEFCRGFPKRKIMRLGNPRKYADLNEPLFHNNTAFPIILLGFNKTNSLKDLQRKLNRTLPK